MNQLPNCEIITKELEQENCSILLDEVKTRIAKLRQRGISQYILEQLIHPDDRLSRLVIMKDYRLLLPDYNDMEIKMEPLVKAVYLLFLKHPEGILFKPNWTSWIKPLPMPRMFSLMPSMLSCAMNSWLSSMHFRRRSMLHAKTLKVATVS